jgi:hypothetical protein
MISYVDSTHSGGERAKISVLLPLAAMSSEDAADLLVMDEHELTLIQTTSTARQPAEASGATTTERPGFLARWVHRCVMSAGVPHDRPVRRDRLEDPRRRDQRPELTLVDRGGTAVVGESSDDGGPCGGVRAVTRPDLAGLRCAARS